MGRLTQGIQSAQAVKLAASITGYEPTKLRILWVGKHVFLVLIPGSKFWSSIGYQSWAHTKVQRRGLPGTPPVYASGWFPPEHPAAETDVFDGEHDGRICDSKIVRLIAAARKHDRDYPALLKEWHRTQG